MTHIAYMLINSRVLHVTVLLSDLNRLSCLGKVLMCVQFLQHKLTAIRGNVTTRVSAVGCCSTVSHEI